MKVKDLIAQLQQHDPEADVVLETYVGPTGETAICNNVAVSTLQETQNFMDEIYENHPKRPMIKRDLGTVTIQVDEVINDHDRLNPEWEVIDPNVSLE